jgi:hypothetical protein
MLKRSIWVGIAAVAFMACGGGAGKGGGGGIGGSAGGAAGQGGGVGGDAAPGGRGGGVGGDAAPGGRGGGVGGDAAPGGRGGAGGSAGGSGAGGTGGAGGQDGGCPAAGSASIYPYAACTGGTNCMGGDLICDCVSSQWSNCRITRCPTSTTGPLYPCMSGVTLPASCSCKLTMPATQNVPFCVCNQT